MLFVMIVVKIVRSLLGQVEVSQFIVVSALRLKVVGEIIDQIKETLIVDLGLTIGVQADHQDRVVLLVLPIFLN